jgi:hypothetical protein
MGKVQGERNASIIELRKSGRSYAFLAREFNVSRDRIRQIVDLARREEKRRGELVGKYGARPNVSVLQDETPIEVLELCDGDIHGWAARISHLKWSRTNPICTLGDLRRASDAQLRKELNVGTRMVAELRRFCPRDEVRQEAAGSASALTAAAGALGHLKRALGAIEALQQADIATLPRTASLLKDARAEIEKAVPLLEGVGR